MRLARFQREGIFMDTTKYDEIIEDEIIEEETETRTCTFSPLVENCESCERFQQCMENELKLTVLIPQFIVDAYLPILSLSATKILIFLARHANFSANSTHYGRCWKKHIEIQQGTGVKVSNMDKYLRELKELNLITYTPVKKNIDGHFITINNYSITWFKRIKELKNLGKN